MWLTDVVDSACFRICFTLGKSKRAHWADQGLQTMRLGSTGNPYKFPEVCTRFQVLSDRILGQ